MVSFSVDELQNTTFRSHFGAVGLGDTQERNGFFLAAYITDNSVLQDGFMEGVRTFLDDAVVYKYDSPYQEKDVLEKELMYIIEIKMKTSSLYVTRDDFEYDTKSGFETYEEANAYREECQRSWFHHADYVFS